MTVYDAPKTSYSDTGNVVRIISNVINMIDPIDTPLLAVLGGLDGARSKLSIRGNGTKIEWLEDEYGAEAGAVANGTVGLTTNTLSWTVADASIFKPGTQILIDSEYMVVSASDVTNNTITVHSRSYGGSNDTHATNAPISIVGMARLEGADASYDPMLTVSIPYNYTSILQKGMKMTGTEMVVDEYGYGDAWAYQANKAMPELFRTIERQLFHGIRAIGSATTPRSFGGLGTFITTNSVNAGGGIAKTDIDGLAETIHLEGGSPDVLVLHPSVANDLRALLDSSSFVRMTQENSSFGMTAITSINTQYGTLRMVEDRFCPLAKAFMLDTRKIGLYTLRPFGWRELPASGDYKAAQVVGEISLAVANDTAHGWIYGLT